MTIDPLLPVWLILVLLTSLLIWSIVIEWRRTLRYKLFRILACLVAMLSLGVIFLRPATPTPPDTQTILLTPSNSHTVVDSLLRAHSEAVLYHLGDAGYRNSQKLSSYRELFYAAAVPPSRRATTDRNVGRMEAILGDGLPDYALDSIPGGFLYFPSSEPDGITRISLPYQNPQLNHTTTISGTYRSLDIPATLYFSGPGGKLDSTQLSSNTGPFSFSFTPRASGRMTYLLTLVDSMGTRIEERVPVTVDAYSPLNIFMLQDYPTFEMQHLKNFLSDRGHQIALRAQLSRNTYRTEFTNRSATSLNKITSLLLNTFDL
ncbi:MAG TPA: hypothetical protein VK658_08950, partial [Chryseolinea sp.]|nr:hypothetical protein [Chryseolinea sp.]